MQMFHHSLPSKSVARIGVILLDMLGNVFIRVLFIVAFCDMDINLGKMVTNSERLQSVESHGFLIT